MVIDYLQSINEDIHWCPRNYMYSWQVGAGQEFQTWIGGVLWPLTGSALAEWRSEISRALADAKLTASSLPAAILSLPYFEVLDELQAAVGTREWDARKWPDLIRQAEAWLSAEHEIQQTRRQSDRQRRLGLVNIARAQKLAGRTQTQIADGLEISAGYLSKILSRERASRTDPSS